MTTAFVLGGGGLLGAHEVGMLRALAEAGVRPDLVVGTSIGALNGVLVAADPAGAADRLARMWQGEELRLAFSEKLFGRAARLARSGTHLHSLEPLRRMLAGLLPGSLFSDLELPFQCVAANIEGATARWFSSGPVVPAVMASCAVPGLLPPVEIDGEHYFDGGLVDSIPVGRAVAFGRLHGLRAPGGPDRERAGGAAAAVGGGPGRVRDRTAAPVPRGDVVAAGRRPGPRAADRRDRLPPGRAQFRYRDRSRVRLSIERAYAASASYLAALAAH